VTSVMQATASGDYKADYYTPWAVLSSLSMLRDSSALEVLRVKPTWLPEYDISLCHETAPSLPLAATSRRSRNREEADFAYVYWTTQHPEWTDTVLEIHRDATVSVSFTARLAAKTSSLMDSMLDVTIRPMAAHSVPWIPLVRRFLREMTLG